MEAKGADQLEQELTQNIAQIMSDSSRSLTNASKEMVLKTLEALIVKGYDPLPALAYAKTLSEELRVSLAIIAFFLGRITKKKVDVRPLLPVLQTSEKEVVLTWISTNFAGGKLISLKDSEGKEMKVNFSQVASSCLILSSKQLRLNADFQARIQSAFCNSSLLAFKDQAVRLWSYESSAYLPLTNEEFASCIAHMYWRMSTTSGYLAPLVETSLKIRSFVCMCHEIKNEVTQASIMKRYETMCEEAGTAPIIPFKVLVSILTSSEGKRNDDLNVTSEKNTALRNLAAAAMRTIKIVKKRTEQQNAENPEE